MLLDFYKIKLCFLSLFLSVCFLFTVLPGNVVQAELEGNPLPQNRMSVKASNETPTNNGLNRTVNVLDGKSATYWYSGSVSSDASITINLGNNTFTTPPAKLFHVTAVKMTPRSGGTQHIKDYEIYVSDDSTNGTDGTWDGVATGTFTAINGDEKIVRFNPSIQTKYIKIIAKNAGPTGAAISELNVLSTTLIDDYEGIIFEDYNIAAGRPQSISTLHTQTFRLPVAPSNIGTYAVFDNKNITVDGNTLTFKTEQYNKVNVSGYQFTASDMKAKMTFEGKYQPKTGHTSFYEVNNSFTANGTVPIITVIYPRDQGTSDLKEIKALGDGVNTVGFDTTVPAGGNIKYIMAANKNADISIDNISIKGESLLITRDAAGNVKGIALGVESISVGGVVQNPEARDFEFAVTQSGITNIIPIYVPIDPVVFQPGVSAFYDSLNVSLSTKTKNVDIRYTTDGSSPTLSSMLYTGPFTITQSTNVKAAAFRKGISKMPVVESGTTMSHVTNAYFEKKQLKNSVEANNLTQGLSYDYYQGNWKDMYVLTDAIAPIKSGTVSRLFDISERQTEDAFQFKYKGFINVPADGIYTFHVPDEYVDLSIDAGYTLRLCIDGEKWDLEAFRHAKGTWSVGLKTGMHAIEIKYLDYREHKATVSHGGETAVITFDKSGEVTGKDRMNFPTHVTNKNITWDGTSPQIMISGPGMEKQEIPETMLYYN